MRLLSKLPFITLLSIACFAAVPGTLHAQASKIFVASYGNDVNDGSIGAPKRAFQAAHNAVAAGGQIVVLDTAGYGALTITKSVAITVPPGVNGFVTVAGNSNGILINAGSSGVVSLRGLIVEGGGAGTTGWGITAITVGHLSIEDCTVRSFDQGIFFIPNNNGKLYVYNTTVRNCSFGIYVGVVGSFAAVATINGSRLEQNSVVGVEAHSPAAGTTSVDVSVGECIISGNGRGINADGNAPNPAVVRVSNSSITGNDSGIFVTGIGQIISRTNNTLEKNPNSNTFTGTYSAK